MTSPGLTPTDQFSPSPVARVDLDGRPVTEIWRTLFEVKGVRDAFVRAVRAFAKGRTPADLFDRLDDRDVPPTVASYVYATARGDHLAALRLAVTAVPNLSHGQSRVDDLLATASLFDALDDTPTLDVRLGDGFRERDRRQRVDVCRLLEHLGRGFDVRLVGSGHSRRWLADTHRDDLPGVENWRNAYHDSDPVADRVDRALADLDPDSRKVGLLRTLADAPDETLSYAELKAASTAAESTVRGYITDLEDRGLVETFDSDAHKKAGLLPAGHEYLNQLTRQSTLSDSVENDPTIPPKAVLSREREGGEGDGDQDSTAGRDPYRNVYMDHPTAAAAVACGRDGAVSLVRHPDETDATDRRRWVYPDADRDEVVVGARATTPRQYLTSTAIALTSPKVLDEILPPSRLESVVEAVEDSATTLRDRRCIGWLPDEALADGETLRDTLVEAGRDLAGLTTDLKQKDRNGEDVGGLPATILEDAHGLGASVVHLLDVAGVDVVREIRVPDGLANDALDALAFSIARSAPKQSKYGAYSANRQLFEPDEEKRQAAGTPDVDAADPQGALIGSFVIRGADVHRLRRYLTQYLTTPDEVVDDAPEFIVPVEIREAGREAFETAARRVLQRKRIWSTETTVSLLEAFVGTPYDAAQALNALGKERRPRDVQSDEIRYALAKALTEDWGFGPDRILPDAAPSCGKIVAALLAAEEPLTQVDLANRADVSTESVRRHRETLEALAILDAGADGYRLALPFADERDDPAPALPWYAVPNAERDDLRDATEKGVIWEAVEAAGLPPDDARQVREATTGYLSTRLPPDARETVLEAWPSAEPYLDVVRALAADEPAREGATETVAFGPEPAQTALSTVVTAT